jgi:ADP-ribosylglycohydrolase
MDIVDTNAAGGQAAIDPRGRWQACLLGGAIGDALGAAVEFLPRERIFERFGAYGIKTYEPAYGGLGRITDDTQMTLFTAEGLLRGWIRFCGKGITTYAGLTAQAYLRWLMTQGERPPAALDSSGLASGWLFAQPELHARRAPGNTCLSALRNMRALGVTADNDSKGCGGVMRVAPVGLFGARVTGMAPTQSFALGCELAALTHGHPSGSLSAGTFAMIVHELVLGTELPAAIDHVCSELLLHPGHTETLAAVRQAQTLAAGDMPPALDIAELGEGWVAEEALAISLYCALRAGDFSAGLRMAVNHDGDSDSTGAITGNLLGAMWGMQAIDPGWLEPLELREVIRTLADDLFDFVDWPIGEYAAPSALADAVLQRYG